MCQGEPPWGNLCQRWQVVPTWPTCAHFFQCVSTCHTVFQHVQLCGKFANVCHRLATCSLSAKLGPRVAPSVNVCHRVPACATVPTYVITCQRVPTLVNVCQRMPSCANVNNLCQRGPSCANVCTRVLSFCNVFQHVPTSVSEGPRVPPCGTVFRCVPPFANVCQRVGK